MKDPEITESEMLVRARANEQPRPRTINDPLPPAEKARAIKEAQQEFNSLHILIRLMRAGVRRTLAQEAAMKCQKILHPLIYPEREKFKKIIR